MMEDTKIIDLYFQRSEEAISASSSKYGGYCYTIANNILGIREDCEECVNDTWMHAWNAMPPQRPLKLGAFLGKITRNLALNVYEKYSAQKRGGGQTEAIFDELEDFISSSSQVEHRVDEMVLTNAMNRFLENLPERNRNIFILRYWNMHSVSEIANAYTLTQSNVKMILMRTRKQLQSFLVKEGIEI